MNVHLFLSFTSADSSLGRIDKASLSQQTLMELLIVGFTNKEICGDPNDIKDIAEWTGLRFNDSNEITEIDWHWQRLSGTIELKWFPQSLEKAYFTWNGLTGTVDLTCLPEGLQDLGLSLNNFEGTVDLRRLPQNMKYISLNHNNFVGSTDFSCLPKSLVALNIDSTKLEGEIFEFDGDLNVANSNVKDMRNR